MVRRDEALRPDPARAQGWRAATATTTSCRSEFRKRLSTLLLLILIFGFIIPNPTQTGAFIGNAIDSMIVFFRSIASSVGV